MNIPVFNQTRSAEIRAQLIRLSNSQASASQNRRRPKARRRRPVIAVAMSGILVLCVAAVIQMSAAKVQAETTLKDLAQVSISYEDPQPGADEYLKVDYRGYWEICSQNELGKEECGPGAEQVRNTYRPADPSRDWVYEMRDVGRPEYDEVVHAPNGAFWGTPMTWVEDLLPYADDGAELYEYVNSTYRGGSASRDEDNFVRLNDALRSGIIPAKQRAAFYEALSRVPGVTVTLGVVTADGRMGVSIGRTEPLRLDERAETIVDPATGQVIGERVIRTIALFGYGKNEVVGQSTMSYSVANQVPQSTREPVPLGGVSDDEGRDG